MYIYIYIYTGARGSYAPCWCPAAPGACGTRPEPPVRVVHLGRSICHAISGRGHQSTKNPERRGHVLSFQPADHTVEFDPAMKSQLASRRVLRIETNIRTICSRTKRPGPKRQITSPRVERHF